MSTLFGDAGVDLLLNEVLVIETKIKNICQVNFYWLSSNLLD